MSTSLYRGASYALHQIGIIFGTTSLLMDEPNIAQTRLVNIVKGTMSLIL